MARHRHQLTPCDCNKHPQCTACHGRGYYEHCRHCGEPLGRRRRAWKRHGRPPDWIHPHAGN